MNSRRSPSPANVWRSLAGWAMTRDSSTPSDSSLSSNFLKNDISDQPQRRAENLPHEQPGSFWKTVRSREKTKSPEESTVRKRQPEVSPPQVTVKEIARDTSEQESGSSPARSGYATPPGSMTGAPRQTPRLESTSPWLREHQQSSSMTQPPDSHVGEVSGLQPTPTPDKSPQKSLRHKKGTSSLRQRASASPAPASVHGRSVRKEASEPRSLERARKQDILGAQPSETPRRSLQRSPHHEEKASSVARRTAHTSTRALSPERARKQDVSGEAPQRSLRKSPHHDEEASSVPHRTTHTSTRALSPERARKQEVSGAQPSEAPQRSLRRSPRHDEEASSVPRRSTHAFTRALQKRTQGVRKNAPRSEPVSSRRVRQMNGSQTPAKRPRKQHGPKTTKKPRGYRVLKEIRRYQKSTKLLIPRLPFARVVREVLRNNTDQELRMQKLALMVLQDASEAVIARLLEGCNILAQHTRRVTIKNRDLDTLLKIISSYGSLQRCLA